MSETRTIAVVITGRVQGVSYGAVEAMFSGQSEAVAQMETLCWSGPPGARVTDVAVRNCDDIPTLSSFEILRG
jgi:acylphosphatase